MSIIVYIAAAVEVYIGLAIAATIFVDIVVNTDAVILY